MIVTQETKYHWQLVVSTSLDTELASKISTIFLFLVRQCPNISPNNQFKFDLEKLLNIDICGTCLLPQNTRLVGYLKYHCIGTLKGSLPPKHWETFICHALNTSVVHIYTYAKTIKWTGSNQLFVNSFISNGRNAEYDRVVFIAKTKASTAKLECGQ